MGIDLLKRAEGYRNRKALVSEGRSYSYSDLLESAHKIASFLLNGRKDLNEARIAFLVAPSFNYTAVQWGIWMAGGIAVPLCELHPLPSMQYVLQDTRANFLIAGPGFDEKMELLSQSEEIALLKLDFLSFVACLFFL